MKQNLLFTLLALLLTVSLFSQQTYIPDDNFEQALIDLGLDSGALNDSVPTSAIDTLTILEIKSKGIASLTGIQNFTSLKNLNCYNNQIAEVDFSANTKLEVIFLDKNQFTNLDVSMLTNLKEFGCSDNQLTTIDVSNNTNLEGFYCGKNQLTSIDLSNNQNLVGFYCNNNQFRTLTIQGFEHLEKVNCSVNLLTELTITNCPEIDRIDSYENKLTSVNFSSFPNLLYLRLQKNQLTEIDVSNFSGLKYFSIYQNQLTEIDVSSNPILRDFECSYNSIASLDVRNCPVLYNLNCSDNQLTELNLKNGNIDGLYSLAARNNPNLTCIDVDDEDAANAKPWQRWGKDATAVYSENCGNFAELLTYVPDDNFEQALIDLGWDTELNDSVLTGVIKHIVSLDIRNKNIADLTGIEDFTALQSLTVYGNDIDSVDFRKNSNLVNLSISGNSLNTLDVSTNTKLEKLSCGGNNLSSLNVEENILLKELIVGTNQLTDINVSQNTLLEVLNCPNNQIPALNLASNPLLIELGCDGNPLTEINLTNNPEMEKLFCSHTNTNSILFPEHPKIYRFACESANLTEIDVSMLDSLNFISVYNNELTELDLSNNLKLNELICSENELTSLILPENNVIAKLQLRKNKLSEIPGLLSSDSEKSANTQFETLTYLNVEYNNFIFAAFENSWEELTQLDDFYYGNQNRIGIEKDTTVDRGTSFILKPEGYIQGENDVFKWYVNGVLIEGEEFSNIVFSPVEYDDNGNYYCVVTNTLIPDLELRSEIIKLTVSTPTGNSEILKSVMNVYPNPATNKIFVETGYETVSLRILNQAGQNIYWNQHFKSSSLDIHNLTPGMYIIQANNFETTSTFKLLVK